MERHIVEILVFLIKQFPQGAILPEEFEPLTKDLIGQGYTPNEIESALFWFYNRQENRGSEAESETLDSSSFRVLHEVEKTIFTPGAYGYLIELRQLGLLTLNEMNLIIEKAMLLGGRKVDLEDMKLFVAAQIFDQEAFLPMPNQSFFMKTPSHKIQ